MKNRWVRPCTRTVGRLLRHACHVIRSLAGEQGKSGVVSELSFTAWRVEAIVRRLTSEFGVLPCCESAMPKYSPIALVLLAGCAEMGFLPAEKKAEAPTVFLGKPEGARGPVVQASAAPATEAQARVDKVGKQLLITNPQVALKLTFRTMPSATPDVHHEGELRVVISDGMVAACSTDAQLAGVLALELASIIADRENWQEQGTDRLPPIEVPIGQDGRMGYADQIHKAEVAKLGMDRRRPAGSAPTPDPEKLAATYLNKAGYGEGELLVAARLWQAYHAKAPRAAT